MLALFLLLSLTMGQLSTTELTSATFAFGSVQKMTGEVANQRIDALLIEVTDITVNQLRAYLNVTSGDADLMAITTINRKETSWTSSRSGNDELVIRKTDPAFTDGKGLMRIFIFGVIGYSTTPSVYELTVTAEKTVTYVADSAVSLPDFLAANQQLEVMQVKSIDYQISLPEDSSLWPWVCAVSVMTVLSLAVWTHYRLARKDTEYVVF